MKARRTYILKLADLPEEIREFVTHLPADSPVIFLSEDSQPWRVVVSHNEGTASAVLRQTLRYGVRAVDASAS